MDYRDVGGRYDRVISVEMFEAVGETHWPTYFRRVHDLLKPGGAAGLQIITIDDERFADYRARTDFIQKYIFPGGMLPSPSILHGLIERAGLALTGETWFGPHYARTLALWRRVFEHEWPTIRTLGFDERFRRLWSYYLSYCEGGFRSGAIDVGQFRIERPSREPAA
jgi:cyclopropane-fatty-acyl-phospholipid synthase